MTTRPCLERESESESEGESEAEEDAEPAVAEEPVDEPPHKVVVDSARASRARCSPRR